MTLQIPFRNQDQETELFFPMQLKQMTKQETKEYHLKKLYELSIKSLGQIPQLDDPTFEQNRFIEYRLAHQSTFPKVHENKIGNYKNWSKCYRWK